MRKTTGLTLVEILVTSAIIMTIAGFSLAAYSDFNNRQILNSTTDELKNNLRQARGWAMAGRKTAGCTGNLIGYQVSFLPNFQYRMEAVCPNMVLVNTFFYSDKVVINTGQNQFIFQALTGETGHQFEISLVLGARSRSLNINSNGEVN
jgi:Tfp pilus assembly protein FimT